MKKRMIVFITAAALLILCACGSANKSADYESASAAGSYEMNSKYYADEEYAAAEYDMAEEPAAGQTASKEASSRPYDGDVKLIYRADLSAETTDIEKTSEEIEKLVDTCGGYVESSNKNNYSYSSYSSIYAYYTIRVPQEQFNFFLDSLNNSGVCNVTSISKSTTDVGAEYADTEARLQTYRIKQERLQELLKQAETMEDIITIENALSDIEYEIEYYSSSLRQYDSLINFSTITIELAQVNREQKSAAQGTLGERIASSFSNGIANFASGFEDFVIAVAGAIIPLLIIAAIIAVIVIVIVKLAGKRNRRKQKKEQNKEQNREQNREQNKEQNKDKE